MAFAILHPLSSILSFAVLAYTPFVTPLPVWNYWPLLLLPLAAAVAVVYKTIKCNALRDVPWQAFVITCWIVFGMVAAAVVLAGIVKVVEM